MEKPSKINAGEVLVHAFAEFTDAHSATEALNALQVGCPRPSWFAACFCEGVPGRGASSLVLLTAL